MDTLITLLSNFVSIHNATRNDAERAFEEAKQTSPRDVVLCLVNLLAYSDQYAPSLDPAILGREGMCSLSAVLLRGITLRQETLWNSLETGELESCRTLLLQALRMESSQHVQRKIADTVAVHAKLSPWPELLSTVQELAQVDDRSRQLSMYLLARLAEHIGDFLTAHMDTVWAIIAPAISSGDVAASGADNDALLTATVAAQAVCSILEETPEDHGLDAAWISGLDRSVSLAASLGMVDAHDDAVEQLLSGLLRLAETRASVFTQCYESVMRSLLTLATCITAENSMRSLALQIATELLTNHILRPCAAELPGVREAVLVAIMSGCQSFDASDEGTAEFLATPETADSGIGFGDGGEGGEGDLAGAAGSCLDIVSKELDPDEVLRVCLHAAWGMLSDEDWRARRTALYITSVICSGTRSKMYQHLPQLVPPLLLRTADPHPRVRYMAAHCLVELIREFRAGDDDDDDDDDRVKCEDDEGGVHSFTSDSRRPRRGRILPFQRRFCTVVPPALCAALQANAEFPRVSFMIVHALRLFYDPDYCAQANIDAPLVEALMQHCLQMLSTLFITDTGAGSSEIRPTTYPLYVLNDTASLFGNLCTFCNVDSVRSNYTAFMGLLSSIVGDLSKAVRTTATAHASASTDEQNAVTKLRGKCLEAAILVGRAVGLDLFRPMGTALLEQLSLLTEAGLDFSDEMSSQVTQACVRLAGLMGSEFHPYVSRLLPALVSHIAEDVHVEVTEVDDATIDAGGADENAEVVVVHRRGQAPVRIQFSDYALQEKVMSCRVLYQYTIDIPQFLPPFVPQALTALTQVMQSMAFGEECAQVACACVTELLSIYCTHTEANDANLLQMQVAIEVSLNALLQVAEERHEWIRSGKVTASEHDRLLSHVFSEVRGVLQLLYRLRNTFVVPWPVVLPPALGRRVLLVCRDQLMFWMNTNFAGVAIADEGTAAHGEQEELGEELREAAIDSISWTLKLSGCGASVDSPSSAVSMAAAGPVDVMASYVEDNLPMLQGVLSVGLTSDAAAPLIVVPITCLCEAIECPTLPPHVREAISAELLPHMLTLWENETLIVPCIFGLGVCCQYGNPSAEQVAACLIALIRVLGMDPTGQPVELDLDEDHSVELQDAAVLSIMRMAVYRQTELGADMAGKLLLAALEQFPLSADATGAGDAHAWLLALICDQDARLLGLEEPIGSLVRTACFRAVSSLLLTLDSALAKRNQRASKGVTSGKRSSKKNFAFTTGTSASIEWKAGEEDEFWSQQVARKDSYARVCFIIVAGLQSPDATLLACLTESFTANQLKTLKAYADGYQAC